MSTILNAKELKESASIVELLRHLGYVPIPKRGRDAMYISMLRDDDRTPSFSVNDDLGVWFDHGTGKGGNIIDFGVAYWKTLTFHEVVRKIQEVLALEPARPVSAAPKPPVAVKKPHYVVHQVKKLGTHPAITSYLKSRGVFDIAKKFLSEVYYYIENEEGERKPYFAAGWLNEANAWEVRNRYFKGCMGHKSITVIPGHAKSAVVFEGYLDFLSWKTEHPDADHTVIVLNSLSLLHQGINKAKMFASLDVFFDLDRPGRLATKEFIKALPYATDRSAVYEGFNDYNDKLKAQFGVNVPEPNGRSHPQTRLRSSRR
ncbi:toprim domain-containing protein [Mucilaginibacter sp. Bleaf8]|uniref:CHC2 zinc finger domain-containing protein n=1 Tax=Mucilaginibacter sp. Bleaf8 TaxID=2834430 RepID=UPI001BCCDC13|nr:CHC2 zinc finger domain-containing protein [Mucilaginibacter sp. Bleaf8]MBS7565551.1 toprim domain-containing protein [Mucilaginibacter sp. Bleaf8]